MAFYTVYFVENGKQFELQLRDVFVSEPEKIKENLVLTAVKNIRMQEGNHADSSYCENRTYNHILNDPEFREGSYLLFNDNNLDLYEKRHVINKGWVWNSTDVKLVKKGTFFVNEISLEQLIENRDFMNNLLSTFIQNNSDKKYGQIIPTMSTMFNTIATIKEGEQHLEKLSKLIKDEIFNLNRSRPVEVKRGNPFLNELEVFIKNPTFKKTGINLN